MCCNLNPEMEISETASHTYLLQHLRLLAQVLFVMATVNLPYPNQKPMKLTMEITRRENDNGKYHNTKRRSSQACPGRL